MDAEKVDGLSVSAENVPVPLVALLAVRALRLALAAGQDAAIFRETGVPTVQPGSVLVRIWLGAIPIEYPVEPTQNLSARSAAFGAALKLTPRPMPEEAAISVK